MRRTPTRSNCLFVHYSSHRRTILGLIGSLCLWKELATTSLEEPRRECRFLFQSKHGLRFLIGFIISEGWIPLPLVHRIPFQFSMFRVCFTGSSAQVGDSGLRLGRRSEPVKKSLPPFSRNVSRDCETKRWGETSTEVGELLIEAWVLSHESSVYGIIWYYHEWEIPTISAALNPSPWGVWEGMRERENRDFKRGEPGAEVFGPECIRFK